MSTIWTPSGEHEIKRSEQHSEPSHADQTGDSPDAVKASRTTDTDDEQELTRLEAELRSLPAEDVIANHCYGLFQLAAIHLSSDPPDAKNASLAIDAMGAIVDSLGERLGQSAAPLKEELTQIRLAYVKITSATNTTKNEEAASK